MTLITKIISTTVLTPSEEQWSSTILRRNNIPGYKPECWSASESNQLLLVPTTPLSKISWTFINTFLNNVVKRYTNQPTDRRENIFSLVEVLKGWKNSTISVQQTQDGRVPAAFNSAGWHRMRHWLVQPVNIAHRSWYVLHRNSNLFYMCCLP